MNVDLSIWSKLTKLVVGIVVPAVLLLIGMCYLPVIKQNELALSLLCTGVAYLLYFRLIAHLGPANAVSVTFLIPAFAVVWGGMFLHESVSAAMAAGCAVVVLGTSLATGFWRPRLLAS